MISIYLNKKMIQLEKNISLAELLKNECHENALFAIAINREFVARSLYPSTFLNDGDTIELVSPMQGG